MLKKYIAICFLLLQYTSYSLASSKKDFLPDFSCKKEILKITKKNSNPKQTWTRHIDENHQTKIFRRPLKSLGRWYELRIVDNSQPALLEISNNDSTFYKFDSKCKVTKRYGPGLIFESYEPNQDSQLRKISSEYSDFTDNDLASEIKNAEGFIYVWSPNMVYSVTNLNDYKKFAADKKMKFIAVMGHDSSFENGQLALNAKKVTDSIRKLASVELFMRDAPLHYPTFYYFNSGKLHPRYIRGILMPKDLEEHFSTLKSELVKNIY